MRFLPAKPHTDPKFYCEAGQNIGQTGLCNGPACCERAHYNNAPSGLPIQHTAGPTLWLCGYRKIVLPPLLPPCVRLLDKMGIYACSVFVEQVESQCQHPGSDPAAFLFAHNDDGIAKKCLFQSNQNIQAQ
jgi:hypothetical protein